MARETQQYDTRRAWADRQRRERKGLRRTGSHTVGFGERYELIERIGTGGMANVYRVRERGPAGLRREFAIKRIRPGLLGESLYLDMFVDEARLSAAVQSPYVVTTHDMGTDPVGVPFIVMDLIEGAALQQLILKSLGHGIPLAIASTVLVQAARGLHDAREAAMESRLGSFTATFRLRTS